MSVLESIISYASRIWGSTLPNRLVWAICVAIVFELLVWLVNRRLRKAFAPVLQRDLHLEATERVRHRKVLLGLPLLLTRGLLYTVAMLVILRYLGFNTGAEFVPLLIAAAAVATAIFWQVFRDAAAGYFIMYDGLYAAGDRVTIGDHNGVVAEVGLRCTRLRGTDGREIAIANSQVREVINHTRASEGDRRSGRL
jgi:small conductance mechanosensitive channel